MSVRPRSLCRCQAARIIRIFVWSAAALSLLQPVWAQQQNVGCDGKVELKAGRSGPYTALARQIQALVEDSAVARAHWGIAVTAIDGAPIYSLNEGKFFQPASNAKLFTTTAAMALLGPETTFETRVIAKGVFSGTETLTGNLVVVGDGDANLSGREIPYVSPEDRPKPAPPEPAPLRYLEGMADQIAATGLKVVNGDVVGDDTLFPWEPYPADWSIDDMVWGYGAPVSALTINDNQIKVTVSPADSAGKPATVAVDPVLPSYYTLDIAVTTGEKKSGSHVGMDRPPGSKMLRIWGSIAVDARPDVEEIAIQDPAEYAAMALKEMLETRGITVTGQARGEHRLSVDTRGFVEQTREPIPGSDWMREHGKGRLVASCGIDCEAQMRSWKTLATHLSYALKDDVVLTNKVSQNLHAEIMLHELGAAVLGDGSTAQGARVVRQFLQSAGIDKDDFVFFDGSGLSGHDLVTPRATVRLLQYASTQPWFPQWKMSLPVGGVDGSLEARFAKPPLKGKVWAKTGTLGEARALSGYVECASGRTAVFSIMVDNHAPQNSADREAMDKIVAAVAAAN